MMFFLKKQLKILVLIGLVLFSSFEAYAAKTLPSKPISLKDEQTIFQNNLAVAGVTYSLVGDKLSITIDEDRTISALPGLGVAGVIPKFRPEDIKKAPLGLSIAVVGVSFTVVIIDYLYNSQKNLDKLHVQAFIIPSKSKTKQLCYSFNYNRAMHKNMNLDSLTPKAFMLATPGFNFSTWCRTNMENEAKLR